MGIVRVYVDPDLACRIHRLVDRSQVRHARRWRLSRAPLPRRPSARLVDEAGDLHARLVWHLSGQPTRHVFVHTEPILEGVR